jgi:adenylate cyclase class 1
VFKEDRQNNLPPERPQPIQERFTGINRERMQRLRTGITPTEQSFLDLLPLLFHWNHPALPGYAGEGCPAGIAGYLPDESACQGARIFTHSTGWRLGEDRLPDILGIYFMGSSGSIAQSRSSDYDVWVCHREGLTAIQVDALNRKARRIEVWARRLGMEVHFFVFHPAQLFAMTPCPDDQREHNLPLLDEFYRSAVVAAGQYPRWWFTSPGVESSPLVIAWGISPRLDQYTDFGPPRILPPEIFVSASLRHFQKSVRSPHKSFLKLLLLETYASEYPHTELLCAQYKKAVFAGVTDIDALDPYVLMYQRIERYLMEQGDSARLELARCCFYLKAAEKLSQSEPGHPENWRCKLLRSMVRDWGWPEDRLNQLDSRNTPSNPIKTQLQSATAAMLEQYKAGTLSSRSMRP